MHFITIQTLRKKKQHSCQKWSIDRSSVKWLVKLAFHTEDGVKAIVSKLSRAAFQPKWPHWVILQVTWCLWGVNSPESMHCLTNDLSYQNVQISKSCLSIKLYEVQRHQKPSFWLEKGQVRRLDRFYIVYAPSFKKNTSSLPVLLEQKVKSLSNKEILQ